ncbi:DUF2789 domain-containing protein [Limnohabitans sp. TS-CS-82]|jgi:hypothetical protein|uniref:DUF2789 domain-containing protein n=1 Tax=Limnohabitans sp. TS-CS-82 TaxID=2094193 RepID=UPI000CF1CFAD|nr:DUF2789 domain-containing protein [Limnohabitans sp. TS-CS-82]PQA81732.1 DUF2789 domain-containing protein [Limnohabitans sp. TS-CS-82]
MEQSIHRFTDLFAQLGLPSDPTSIAQFVRDKQPLSEAIRLPDAPFWTQGQSEFLSEALAQNSDWAELVDQLSLALRAPPHAVASELKT